MTEKTFLFEIREAARLCSKLEYKAALIHAANELDDKIGLLANWASKAYMQDLNAAWCRADKLLAATPPEGSPDPIGGDTEAAELERKAA